MSFWRPQLKSFFNLFSSWWNSAIASFSAHLNKSFQFSCWEIINLLSMKSSPGRNFRQACRVFYYVSNQRVNVFVLSLNFQCIVNYLVRHLLTLAWPIFFNEQWQFIGCNYLDPNYGWTHLNEAVDFDGLMALDSMFCLLWHRLTWHLQKRIMCEKLTREWTSPGLLIWSDRVAPFLLAFVTEAVSTGFFYVWSSAP